MPEQHNADPSMDQAGNSLSLGHGRTFVRARGQYVIVALLIALLIALGWREFDRSATATTAEHQKIVTAQELLAKEFGILSYLISLPPDERPRLMPPPGLWDRIDRGEGRRR